ncbi:hypothetical protein [Cribrihabitans neustonicus]|uniref:hypothetical protein n=1 Tax=Cribrihabitans neustonicus TaxID=1429085 RepID=UPI003B592D76
MRQHLVKQLRLLRQLPGDQHAAHAGTRSDAEMLADPLSIAIGAPDHAQPAGI